MKQRRCCPRRFPPPWCVSPQKAWRGVVVNCYAGLKGGGLMKIAQSIFASAVICAILLAIAFTPGAKAQTREELIAQSEHATQDCKNRFLTFIPQTAVAAMECLNKALAIVLPTYGNNRDLVQTFMAYRAVVGERVQSKKMTPPEGVAEIRQRLSELQTEVQRRNAYAAQIFAAEQQNAQQEAMAAQQNAADRANAAAEAQMYINAFQAIKPAPVPAPAPRLQTTCMQNGNFTYCH